MARGTNNRITFLILTAPFERLGITAADIDWEPFLSFANDRAMVNFLIPIVNDIIVRRPNKIVREMPVRQSRSTRGTFKEFITTDDVEITVDAMMTYIYEAPINLKNDDSNYIFETLNFVASGIESLGVVPDNLLNIKTRQDLLNFVDRLGIHNANFFTANRELARVQGYEDILNETHSFEVFGETATTSINQISSAIDGTAALLTSIIRSRQGRGFADDNLPLREFNHLLRYANVANGVRVTHPLLNKIKVRNVVISNVENQRITSEHQLSVRIKMYSDDPSIYERARRSYDGRTQTSGGTFDEADFLDITGSGELEFLVP